MSKNIFKNITNWYFSKQAAPFWCILLWDCGIVWMSVFCIYALNNGVVYTMSHFNHVFITLSCYLLAYLIGFKIFRTYNGVLRYSSFIDLLRLCGAMLVGIVLITVGRWSLGFDNVLMTVRFHVLLEAFFLSMLLMMMTRIVVKFIFENFFGTKALRRVFIYGAGSGAMAMAKSIRSEKPSHYLLRGFIAPHDNMVGKELMGLRAFSQNESIDVMKRLNVKTLMISPLEDDSFNKQQDFQRELLNAGIKIYLMKRASEWKPSDEMSTDRFKEVEIEDLLPRAAINIDLQRVSDELKGKCIMITGAAGSIGSGIVRQVALFKPSMLVLIDQAETPLHDLRLSMAKEFPEIKSVTVTASICNEKHMEFMFAKYKPEYVFHAAAYKHVPMMEDNPGESVFNNIHGTRVMADLAVKYETHKFVMISTDKAVNPTNVMGCSKRICEMYCQSLNAKEGVRTQFVTTRFGNVLGSNGSVIPLFRQQIKNGGPITVTHPDIIRFFMLIPEACKLVLEAGTMGNGGEIFVFDMGEPVKIVDLANRMIKMSGATNVKIQFTGLRDGEKLYEEVLNKEENTKPSFHEKIKIAKVRELKYDDVRRDIDELMTIAQSYDEMAIVKQMKKMVPEYKSNNSIYEELDK